MVAPDGDDIDIDKIPRPEAPSPSPDQLSQAESVAEQMAEMTPLKRSIRQYEGLIARLDAHCARLTGERDEAQKIQADLRARLDALVPEHAKLQEGYRRSQETGALSALLLLVGGTMISVAGALPDITGKPYVLAGGIALFVSGFIVVVYSSRFNRIKEARPGTPERR